jgi:hypothetical protein
VVAAMQVVLFPLTPDADPPPHEAVSKTQNLDAALSATALESLLKQGPRCLLDSYPSKANLARSLDGLGETEEQTESGMKMDSTL